VAKAQLAAITITKTQGGQTTLQPPSNYLTIADTSIYIFAVCTSVTLPIQIEIYVISYRYVYIYITSMIAIFLCEY